MRMVFPKYTLLGYDPTSHFHLRAWELKMLLNATSALSEVKQVEPHDEPQELT